MSNFKTKCKNCGICFTFATLGSRRVSKEAEIFKELEYFGLVRYFPAKMEQTLKNRPKTRVLGSILDVFEVCSILAEKQRPKPKNSSSLKISASFDTLLDPRGVKVKEISQFTHFVLKFDNSGALYDFFSFSSK